MKRFPNPVLALGLLVSVALAPLRAAENAMAPVAAPTAPHFIDTRHVDIAAILPPPPAADSIGGKADLQTVLDVQAWRTPEQVAWARRVDASDGFIDFAEDLLGPDFTAAHFPRYAALWRAVRGDVRPADDAAKTVFAHPRPFRIDPRIHPCIALPAGDSYPSGHAVSAYLRAAILAEIYPDRRDALFIRAARIGWGRVIAGVHYPSDIAGSRVLAAHWMSELMTRADFRNALAECRQEAKKQLEPPSRDGDAHGPSTASPSTPAALGTATPPSAPGDRTR